MMGGHLLQDLLILTSKKGCLDLSIHDSFVTLFAGLRNNREGHRKEVMIETVEMITGLIQNVRLWVTGQYFVRL